MLTEKYIKSLCLPQFWSRGRVLAQENAVMNLRISVTPTMIDFEARVQGSRKQPYRVIGSYNRSEEKLKRISCSCPAFMEYQGLCKHCAAVLIKCVDMEEFQDTASLRGAGVSRQDTDRRQDASERATTPEFKRFLETELNSRSVLLGHDELHGRVRLEPYFTVRGSRLSVEFKLGVGRMYVIKDVYAFAANCLRKDPYEYGKNLKFVHTVEAFEEDSRPLVMEVVSWARQRVSNLSSLRYNNVANRSATLTEDVFARFLLAYRGEELQVTLDGVALFCRMVQGPAPRRLTICGDRDGVVLKTSPMRTFTGSSYVVTIIDSSIYIESERDLRPSLDFLYFLEDKKRQDMFIHKSDVPAFCRELLPRLEKNFACDREGFDEASYGIVPARFQFYLDRPGEDTVSCRALAVYGEEKEKREFGLFDNTTDLLQRDRAAEVETAALLAEWRDSARDRQTALVEGEEEIYRFLSGVAPLLESRGEVFATDAFRRLRIRRQPRVTVSLSIKRGFLQFAYEAEEMDREEIEEILSHYDRKRKYYRLKDGSFLDMEQGDSVSTLHSIREDLNLTDAQMKKGEVRLPAYRALYLDDAARESELLETKEDAQCRSFLRDMKNVEYHDFPLPESLEPVLRSYQKYGFLWLKNLRKNGLGGVLADDMGLGKTLQVIAFLLSEAQEKRPAGRRFAVVITPASLVYNWREELKRFAPELSVTLAVGAAAERRALIEASADCDVLITSYDLLKRDIAIYENLEFSCQIIDEAQYIKNQGTQAAKAVKAVHSVFRAALTGTPIENRLSELWSLFDFLLPGFLYSYPAFRKRYELPAAGEQGKDALARLQRMIRPFVLRRLKKDVLKELPDKLEKNVASAMEGEQLKLYRTNVGNLRRMLEKQTKEEFNHSRIQILSQLTLLREICCDPALVYDDYRGKSAKTDLCMDLIRNGVEGGHKILLFSQFTAMLERLKDRLTQEQISWYSLTGATPKAERVRLAQAFNTDDTSVFCISLKAGGTGLNLTAADIVIHFDPWWNLAVQNQATDRAHRIGQKQVVSVYRLIARESIEEQIVKMQEAKRELADQVLLGEGMENGSFTREELLEILKNS